MHTNTRCNKIPARFLRKQAGGTVCASGYFNPLHKGHIRYLKEAKKLGDCLIVIVNNDKQIKLKGSKAFMDQKERLEIISAIKYVDKAFLSIDEDESVIQTLKLVKPDIFAKGGDRTIDNIPERAICYKLGIKIVAGVGGGKIQSSSKLLKNKKPASPRGG